MVMALALTWAAAQGGASAAGIVRTPTGAPIPCEQIQPSFLVCSGGQDGSPEQADNKAEELTWEIGTIVEIEDQPIPVTDSVCK